MSFVATATTTTKRREKLRLPSLIFALRVEHLRANKTEFGSRQMADYLVPSHANCFAAESKVERSTLY